MLGAKGSWKEKALLWGAYSLISDQMQQMSVRGAEDEKGQVRMLLISASGYTGSDLADLPKWCSKTAGRKVRKKGGREKPGRSPRLAKEMLWTDGAWRALPRLQASPRKLGLFKTPRWGQPGRCRKRQAAPKARWLRHGRMDHGRVGRGSNKESEKLMVRSQEQRGWGGKRGWPGYKGVDVNRPDYVKING